MPDPVGLNPTPLTPEAGIDYDGIRFAPAGPDHAAGNLPHGLYRQDGDLVWAQFGGGHLRRGHLVGRRDSSGVIEAAYCQVGTDGTVVAGRCTSTPTVLPDGRLRLTEQWRREDGSSGVSVIEQVPHEELT